MSSLEIKPLPTRRRSKRGRRKRKEIPEPLPKAPFLLSICAPISSGKGVLISSLLCKKNFAYKNYFDAIYYISPTALNDKTAEPIRNDPNIIVISDIDVIENLDGFLDALCAEQEQECNKDDEILVVLDDMIGYLTKGFSRIISTIRHKRLSIFLSLQGFRNIPLLCRTNTMYWVVFRNHSRKELLKLEEEFGGLFPHFLDYYAQGTKGRYDFLYVDVRKRKLYKNFTECIYAE